jgi:DNA modification methylase
MLRDVVGFYSGGQIHLDPTYSTGAFYKDTGIAPQIRTDLAMGVDCRNLADIPNGSIDSIMFDPPFLTEGTSKAKMKQRFGTMDSIQKVYAMYAASLAEFKRVLKPAGVLYFKCQDTTYWHKNWFTHCYIHDIATTMGFKAQDLFILIAASRMIGSRIKKQEHARKYHSYLWVFKK